MTHTHTHTHTHPTHPRLFCEIDRNLAKTIDRICCDGRQVLVFMLYVKKGEGEDGTFLAQGTACPALGEREVELLRYLVSSVASRPQRTRELKTKFHQDLSSFPQVYSSCACGGEQSLAVVEESHRPTPSKATGC